MPDQPTPKPLTEQDYEFILEQADRFPETYSSRLLYTINSLRESLAAAEKQRDELAAELAEAKRMLDDIDRKAHGFGIGSDNQRLHGICDILAARDSGKASEGGADAR